MKLGFVALSRQFCAPGVSHVGRPRHGAWTVLAEPRAQTSRVTSSRSRIRNRRTRQAPKRMRAGYWQRPVTSDRAGAMATHPIRFGIQTGQQSVPWAEMLALWKKADAWGYDSLWTF